MIQSMTGFGKHVIQLPSKKITIELKSLNGKNLDITTRIPQPYRHKELELRKKVADTLLRGKIDFGLYVEYTGEVAPTTINPDVVKNYMAQLNSIAPADTIKLLELALRLPDTLMTSKGEIDDMEYRAIVQTLEQALEKITDFRGREGQALEKAFKIHLNQLEILLEKIKKIDIDRLQTIRQRLEKAVATLKIEVDANRFEQELIYYLEKYDITEEKVRLANHLTYFVTTLQSDKSRGKKLGFIAQEIGREINTIGAKANYAPMQKLVIQMKDELEKIKEQMLNVL